MQEEDERPPNEKSHAYHFSITYNGCDLCLLTPPGLEISENRHLPCIAINIGIYGEKFNFH